MAEAQQPSPVELATLFVPAAAVEEGIAVASGGGVGDEEQQQPVEGVVLQASAETCETLIDNAAANAVTNATNAANDGGPAAGLAGSGGVDTTCIQAVVDLTKLSELVGVAEDEFVVGLHREADGQPFSPDFDVESAGAGTTISRPIHSGDVSIHEVSVGSRPTTIAAEGEKQPLLPPKPSHKRQATADGVLADVTLDINPFVETLADVLTHADALSTAGTADADGESTLYTLQTALQGTQNLEVKAATTTNEDDHHLGHDAFLLELPQQPGRTEAEHQHHFVLALPEIEAPREEVSTISTVDSTFLPLPLLERALSMVPTQLPTDIRDVQLEATAVPVVPMDQDEPVATELRLDLTVKRRVPLLGYVLLLTGLLALSSVGTALDLQGDDVSPSMKTFWRVTATALALVPFVVRSVRRDGLPRLAAMQWTLFPLAALAYGYMTTAFVVALSMTSLANSFVLSNLTSLVIIVGKAFLGLPILLAEGSGAVIGFTGAAICANDPSAGGGAHSDAAAADDDHSYALLGDLIALSASFGMAAYICIAKDLRNSCDVFVFMFVIMSLSSVFVLAYMVLSGETVLWSSHPNYGLWGWINLSVDRLPLELYMAYICNIVGTMGYIGVLKYFDSVVVATVMLMEPVIAAFIGFAAGVDPLPGIQTWIGDVIVTIGSGLVIFSGARKTESIDATKAMRPRSGTDTEELAMEKTVELLRSPASTKKGPPYRRMSSDHESYRSNSARVVWEVGKGHDINCNEGGEISLHQQNF